MERQGPSSHLDNTSSNVLTVPAGHKYEILEVVWQAQNPAGGQVLAASIDIGGTPYSFYVEVGVPANTYARRLECNHVLYEGDALALAEVGNGGPWGEFVTYIDVDYTS